MVQHKVAKRKGGSSYTYKLCSMEKLLHERESELERVELEQQQLEWKELVLVDVLRHHEAIGAALERFQDIRAVSTAASDSVLHSGRLSPEPMSISLDAQPANEACVLLRDKAQVSIKRLPHSVGNTKPFADIAGQSYTLQLLQKATLQQVQQVLDMTEGDWVDYFRELYRQLAGLLNMASIATEQDWIAVAAATDEQTRGSCAAVSSSNISGSDCEISKLQDEPAYGLLRAAPSSMARRAAAESGVQDKHSQHIPGVCLLSDMLRLNNLVDECFTLLLLAPLFNPMPIHEVMLWHLGTRERYICSPAVRQVVANSLKLTQTQAEQLAVALKQFRSIHSVSSAKYVQLADRACDVGIMVAAAAAERARAGWGATGAASASHITGGNGNPALSASQQTSGASGLQQMGTPATRPGYATAVTDKVPAAEFPTAVAESNIEQQLQRTVYRRMIMQMLEYFFITNTLTHLQKAALLVSSYPCPLLITATEEAVKQKLGGIQHGPAASEPAVDGCYRSNLVGESVGEMSTVSEYWRCMQEDHEQRRSAVLREQRQQWLDELREDWGFAV